MSNTETKKEEKPIGFELIAMLFVIRAILLVVDIGISALLILVAPAVGIYLFIAHGFFKKKRYAYYLGLLLTFLDTIFAAYMFMVTSSLVLAGNMLLNLIVFVYIIQNRDKFTEKIDKTGWLILAALILLPILILIGALILQLLLPTIAVMTKTDVCQYVTNNVEQDACYMKLAVAAEDPRFCQKESCHNLRQQCIAKVKARTDKKTEQTKKTNSTG